MTLAPVAPAPVAAMATAGGLLSEARRALAAVDSPPLGSPALDASLLLAHALALPRTALLARPEMPVGAAERRRFGVLVERRAAGEPLAWLTGRREFWSLDLEVDRSTLVPRPETERLVEAVLAAVGEMGGEGRLRVADLGTGCGAVAIAVAREAAGAEVVATDIDPDALAVAGRNARRIAPGRVELRLGSWCGPLESGAFSVIASNPRIFGPTIRTFWGTGSAASRAGPSSQEVTGSPRSGRLRGGRAGACGGAAGSSSSTGRTRGRRRGACSGRPGSSGCGPSGTSEAESG